MIYVCVHDCGFRMKSPQTCSWSERMCFMRVSKGALQQRLVSCPCKKSTIRAVGMKSLASFVRLGRFFRFIAPAQCASNEVVIIIAVVPVTEVEVIVGPIHHFRHSRAIAIAIA